MRGKNKCKILKQIRQKIAHENDIPLVTQECTYQGECSGTCPRCEAELRYLEQQLARRQALGKAVTVAALSVGLMSGLSGCTTPFLFFWELAFWALSGMVCSSAAAWSILSVQASAVSLSDA